MAAGHQAPHSPCKCALPKQGAISRNLVVCIDGTCNRLGQYNTNVMELYSQLVKSDDQVTYYSPGLGVSANIPGHGTRRWVADGLDSALGRHLENGIMQAYGWLCNNYKDGDKLFFFGFSRGAYQVRALAGMVEAVGLLSPGNNHMIPYAFEDYYKLDDTDNHTNRSRSACDAYNVEQHRPADMFKHIFTRKGIRVHFVGVWDTVSSVGTGSSLGFRRGRTLPLTTSSCDHICYFRHALALDERRVKFLPEYVYGGRAHFSNDDHIKEVWFPGSHSDVGGGNKLNPRLQSSEIPLLWMRGEASMAGLRLEPCDVMWRIDDLDKPITRLERQWWVLEVLPLQHLRHNNTDDMTSMPHMGRPRQILPGQKVHVAALFKRNYKPYGRFYRNFETWPAALFWNDQRSHEALQHLSSTWEMDIFDNRSVQNLLNTLEPMSVNVDALERLAFMATFASGRNIINGAKGAEEKITSLLNNHDIRVRISAAMTYCEIGWIWPRVMDDGQPGHVQSDITKDIDALLGSDDLRRQGRACMSLPSLCKNEELRGKILGKGNLRRLIHLIDTSKTDATPCEISPSATAFHGAQALASLLDLDEKLCSDIIAIPEGISGLVSSLHNHHNAVLVSVLRVLAHLASYGNARELMLAADIVPSLLKLVKPYDDFVAPAAVDVLCMLLSEVSVRLALTENGKVSLFMDMLVKPSDEVRHAGAKALTAFARHDAKMLMQGGYIKKLVKDVQYSRADHRAGAILALVALDAEVPAPVCEALEEAGTINALVTQLGNKSRALAAASALAQLMTIDHVKKTAIESHAAAYICKMLRRRWFDGNDNEDGIGVLQRVLSIAPLRAAILKESSVDLILDMLKEENSDVVYAGLQYMREIIKHDDGRKAFYRPPTIDPLLNALRCPQKPLQRCSIAILQKLYNYKRSTVESLCPRILNGLLSMIKCRRGSELLGTTTALRVLSSDETVRSAVVMHRDFWDLSHAYYNRLMVNCGKKGPNFREVYQAIGGLITCVQEGISQRHQDDSQWLEPQTPLEPTAVF